MPTDTPAVDAENARHLELALEAARMVAWSWDPATDRVTTTGNLRAIYGVSAVEVSAAGFGMIAAEDLPRHRAILDRALRTGERYTSEFRIVRPDNGETVWLEERGEPVLDDDGKLTWLSGVTFDVSARKQAEASLRQAEALHEQAYATLDQVILLLEMPGRIIRAANPAFERVFGYARAEVMGQSTECLHLDRAHFDAFGRLLTEALAQGGTAQLEFEMRRKNGERFFAEILSNEIRDPDGQRTGTVSVVRDITARRQAEVALQSARQAAELAANRTIRLQRVTAALIAAVSVADAAAIIVEQAAEALGASACAIYLLEAAQAALVMASSRGYPEPVRAAVARLPIDHPMPASDVLRSGIPLWLRSNADLVARYPALASARSVTHNEAVAVLPLVVDLRALGVMALSFAEPREFDESDRDFLLALAGQCALALERARLYSREQGARADAEAARQQLALLADASAALAGSLSVAETLDLTARLMLPALGDFCVVYSLDETGAIRPAAGAHADPERQGLIDRLLLVYQPEQDHPVSPVSRVLRTGQPLVLNELPAFTAAGAARLPALHALTQALAPRAVLVAPLIARGRVLGVVALSQAESGRTYSEADLRLAEELTRRAALALDNALLLQTAQKLNAELEARVTARTAALRESETRFHSLVNSVQDYAIFMLDVDGRVASWNAGAVRIKGYTAEEIIGRHFSVFYTPDDAAAGRPAIGLARAAAEGRFETEGWRVRRDGTRLWANVVITPVYAPDGTLAGYAKVTRDLTARRAAEEQVRQSERRLAKAEQIARLGSWYWDIAANKVTWSDELFRIYGLVPQSRPVSYEDFLAFVHPDDHDRVHDIIRQALETRRPFGFDHRIVRADGVIRTLHAAGEAVVDAQGSLVALAGAGQDITERKLIEDELHHSREALRQLSARLEVAREDERARMAREIHDELGGALTGLKMDVRQLGRGQAGQDPATAERLEALTQSIDDAVSTVRRIASDLRPAVLDDFGLVAAMEWQLNEFARRSGLACFFTSTAATVQLPPEQTTAVFRVFQESLTNIARHAEASRVEVSVDQVDGWLSVEVKDDGRGITAAEALGNGSLGLAGMRERIGVLGGTLLIEGRPGDGTRVMVKVPPTE